MTPILIYPPDEAKRNQFVVQKLQNTLGAKLVAPDYRGDAEYVINRTNDYRIAQFYEQRGVRVFNPSQLSRLANDKQLCYDFMEQHGIEIMPTRYSTVPFVKKPINGHGGTGVVMCRAFADYDDSYVCQKPASNLGRDLRVWVLGGEIVGSILRVSNTDFRSNYCLGGSAQVYKLSDDEKALVKKIIDLVQGDYYGIDFVFNNGKAVFNEIEDTVGARMLYDITNIDIIDMYAEYIINSIS
jgi:ribosomal protein S6--L-glutamate ligase/gamma-F420-2:alpha-L-glutamate ligase